MSTFLYIIILQHEIQGIFFLLGLHLQKFQSLMREVHVMEGLAASQGCQVAYPIIFV